LLPYWNLVQKSDNFPKRSYENVATKHQKRTLLSWFKKISLQWQTFTLKKPLTKSSVMKIGCKISVSRVKPAEEAIPGTPCSKRLTWREGTDRIFFFHFFLKKCKAHSCCWGKTPIRSDNVPSTSTRHVCVELSFASALWHRKAQHKETGHNLWNI
jgi:hypothetical protein